MAYDEEEARRSRVVVETPTERREVVHSQSVRDNSGISAGMVGVLVVVAIALITMLVLFWMSSQPATDNANVAATQPPPTTVVQQPAPAQQPPVIIQQPAPATQPAPIIVTPPAGGTTTTPVDVDSTVKTEELKTRIERMVKQVKGVKAVDNQISVTA